jgi:outer membrane lipoprotein LolB
MGQIESVSLEARLAVHAGEQRDSARLFWQGDFVHQHVELLSPLGSVVAVLEHGPEGARLTTSNGRVVDAADSAELTSQVLGYALPLDGLPWWLLGQAMPGSTATAVHDSKGVLQQQEQAGWLICYDRWRTVGNVELPGQVKLTRGSLEVRWIIDQWNLVRR